MTKAPARAPVHFDEMLATLQNEAERIEIMQRQLVEAALRKVADPGELRRAEVLAAAVTLVEIVRADKVITDRVAAELRARRELAAATTQPAEATS